MKAVTRALLLFMLSASRAEEAVETEEDEEEEEHASILFYKKMDPPTGHYVGEPINVTLSVFNKGPGNAYSIFVKDDSWKMDKFRVIHSGNNFSLDYLNAGDSYEHSFVIKPIRKTWHRVRPAKLVFIDGVEGEQEMYHLSNTLPEMRIAAERGSYLETSLLYAGRVVTLNTVQTKEGWTRAGVILMLAFVVKLYNVGTTVLQKRRRLRVLEEAKEW